MTEKIIALVDYENIGTLESVRLSRYERLILFTGPQQEFIRFPAVTYAGDISVSVFQVANVSKNNVDFHLVFELGRLREGANKRGNSSRLTQSFHFFMFEPIFSPVNALNQPI